MIADFNFKSSNDTTTGEGAQLDYLTLYGIKKVVIEPTHNLKNSSSRIGIKFSNQPELIMDPRVHPRLHFKCPHEIIYLKLKLKKLQIRYPCLKFGITINLSKI